MNKESWNNWAAGAAAILTVLTAIVGGTVVIENRYAKAQEVKAQLDDYYTRQIKLRILEIDLKPNPTPADKALREYLVQEMSKNN